MENGRQIGKFLLRRRLGEGGMAEVFLAELVGPRGFGKLVALKWMRPDLLEHDDSVQAFVSEARLGGSLNHPNVVETLEFGELEGRYYLALEYVEGVSLARLLEACRRLERPLPLKVVLAIARQLCDGLEYAHSARSPRGTPLKIIHRDLKPGNVLLSLHGEAKIADFGIARATSNLKQTTATGALKGTLAYMSPEQAACEPLDHRSDLYALGAILFEMLTLEPLYPIEVNLPGLAKVIRGRIDDRLELLEPYPSALRACLRRLLAADREQRYPSAAAVKQDLARVVVPDLEPGDDLAAWVRQALASRGGHAVEAASPPVGGALGESAARDGRGRLDERDELDLPTAPTPATTDRAPAPAVSVAAPADGMLAPAAPEGAPGGAEPLANGRPRRTSSSPRGEEYSRMETRLAMGQASELKLEVGRGARVALPPAVSSAAVPSVPPLPLHQAAEAKAEFSTGRDAAEPVESADPRGGRHAAPLVGGAAPGAGRNDAPVEGVGARGGRDAAAGVDEELWRPPRRIRTGFVIGALLLGVTLVGVWLAFAPADRAGVPGVASPADGSNDPSRTVNAAPAASGAAAEPTTSPSAAMAPATGMTPLPASAPAGGAHEAPRRSGSVDPAHTASTSPGAAPIMPGRSASSPQTPLTSSSSAPRAPEQAARAPGLETAAPAASAREPQHRTAAPAEPAPVGFFTVNAMPYAYVYVDGTPLRETTPLVRYALPAGPHTLLFKAEDGRTYGPVQVEIRPGEEDKLKAVIFER